MKEATKDNLYLKLQGLARDGLAAMFQTSLEEALSRGFSIDHIPSFDAYDRSLLHYVLGEVVPWNLSYQRNKPRYDIITCLLDHGADVNIRDYDDWDALILTCSYTRTALPEDLFVRIVEQTQDINRTVEFAFQRTIYSSSIKRNGPIPASPLQLLAFHYLRNDIYRSEEQKEICLNNIGTLVRYGADTTRLGFIKKAVEGEIGKITDKKFKELFQGYEELNRVIENCKEQQFQFDNTAEPIFWDYEL